jgi:hypothetical protein
MSRAEEWWPVATASDAMAINKDTKTCGWRQRSDDDDDDDDGDDDDDASIREASTAAVKHAADDA